MKRFRQTITALRAQEMVRQLLENTLSEQLHQCQQSGADCRCVEVCIGAVCRMMCEPGSDNSRSLPGS